MMTTGGGSTADRTAQNDSEGFVSRYNKFASLSLKRQRELLPIFKHRTLIMWILTDFRDITLVPGRELSSDNCLWTDRLWKVNSYVVSDIMAYFQNFLNIYMKPAGLDQMLQLQSLNLAELLPPPSRLEWQRKWDVL